MPLPAKLGWLCFLLLLARLLVFGEPDPPDPLTAALRHAGLYGWFVGLMLTVIAVCLACVWRTIASIARARARLRELQLRDVRDPAAAGGRARNERKDGAR